MQYSTSYSATRFLSTEIKIIQFPGGFRLKLRLIFMPTNLEYRTRERQRKREIKVGGRPAKLSEKKGDRDLQREIRKKNKGDIILLEET